MQLTRRTVLIGGLAGAATLALPGCASKGSGSSGDGTTVSVMGLPPTTNAATRQAFLDQVAAFEKTNPTIHLEPSDAPWDVKTFAAKLAGGKAEAVLRIPLTEPPGLIDRQQVADITAEAKALPAFADFDPKVMSTLTRDGKVYGLPESMYSLGLIYNRTLFAAAGLDPDNPPKTWDEFRAAAKQITKRTGQVGYAPITTNNSGGWHLTAMTYANGGVMQKTVDGKAVAAFNDAPTLQALQLLKAMRYEDNSLGTNMLRKAEDVAPDFAAGKVGMWINGTTTYNSFITRFGGKAKDFGASILPQGAGNATLLGGTVEQVTARVDDAQRAAAIKWIDYEYVRPNFDPDAAAAVAKAQAADELPVGIPLVPVFGQAIVDKVNAAIAPYVNVPVAQFKPYVEGTKTLEFVPEPAVAAQDLYAALDPVVQAILTKPDADPQKLLAAASDQVDAILRQQQS